MSWGLRFAAFPMHEVVGHPEAAEVMRLFAQHIGAAEFEPLATTGVPLALRVECTVLGMEAQARAGNPRYQQLVASGIVAQLRREHAWLQEHAAALSRALRQSDVSLA